MTSALRDRIQARRKRYLPRRSSQRRRLSVMSALLTLLVVAGCSQHSRADQLWVAFPLEERANICDAYLNIGDEMQKMSFAGGAALAVGVSTEEMASLLKRRC